MTGREKIAKDFGMLLAEDAGPDELDARLARQKAAVVNMVVEGAARPRPAVSSRRIVAAVSVAAAAACFAIYFGFFSVDDHIAFFVNDTTTELEEGHFIGTASNVEVVRFSGGHRFQFSAETKARVVKASAGQVIVDLEQGEVLARVVPESRTAWTVRAGSYQVVVKGTVFSVRWDDAAAVLSVSVDRGKVAVHGPGMDENGVFVAAGNSLRADSSKGRITFEQHRAADTIAKAEQPVDDLVNSVPFASDVPTTGKGASEVIAEAADSPPKGSAAAPDWQKMYADKDFKGIMDSADKKGIEVIKRRLGKDDLWIVAHSARYLRNNKLADELFEVIRSRFPSSGQSQTAAFLLAKSSLESGDLSGAERWFETYLSENSDGVLAEEALGRLIHVYSRLGNSTKAIQTAQTYLDKYKGGYFTKQAGIVINGQ